MKHLWQIAVLFSLLALPSSAQTTSALKYYKALTQQHLVFINYTRDFLDFAQSDEYNPASDLGTAANDISEYIASALAMLEIYDDLSCPSDRIAARTVIYREFSIYSKKAGLEIKAVNLGISNTKKPGIAVEATRMRDDLRKLVDFFDSIKLEN